MQLGGVIVAAGMVLDIAQEDQREGTARMSFLVDRVLSVGPQWVLLDGVQRPGPCGTWRPCRVEVKVSALKRSLTSLT